MPHADRALTPPHVAKLLAVGVGRVLNWIRSGALRAINVSDSSRPRWRIMQVDLDAFLASRTTQPKPEPAPRRRKASKTMDVIEFF